MAVEGISGGFKPEQDTFQEHYNGNKPPIPGLIELHNTDCLKGMDAISDKSIDVVVTSPPYNIGTRYSNYNDSVPREEYLSWLESVVMKIKDKMAESASFFLNIGSSPTNPWGPFEVAFMLKEHFYLQNVIHWIKSIYIVNESYGERLEVNVGHYKPINSDRFLNDTHEYIFHLTKSNKVKLDRLAIGIPYKDTGNIRRWNSGSKNLRCRGNTWYVPYKTINSRDNERPHPASFPPEIAEMCIRLHGVESVKKAMDPFMGIGNTALSCMKLGVACVGFEIDQEYYATSLRLISEREGPSPLSKT